MYHAVADFTNQHAIISEVIAAFPRMRRVSFRPSVPDARPVPVRDGIRLAGRTYLPHRHRRVSDNQVVLHFRQVAEQIGRIGMTLWIRPCSSMFCSATAARLERCPPRRLPLPGRHKHGNGDAAASGAHIQNVLRLLAMSPANLLLISSPIGERGTSSVHRRKIHGRRTRLCWSGKPRNAFVDAANHALNNTVFFAGVRRAVRMSSGISSGR